MNFMSIFLFFLLNIISCGNKDDETEESINEDISGLKKVNLLHSGIERSSLIYIPTSYDKSVMMPIISSLLFKTPVAPKPISDMVNKASLIVEFTRINGTRFSLWEISLT